MGGPFNSGYPVGIVLRLAWVVFLMLYSEIIQFGRITSDVITGMSVTDFTTLRQIANIESHIGA